MSKKNHVLFKVLKKLFNTYLDWVFSWFLNLDLDSWNLEPWILILDSWILLESWILLDSLDFLLESWIVLDSYLELLNCYWFTWVVLWLIFNSHELFFDWSLSFFSSPLSSSFVIIIVIIKTPLNHLWFTMKLCFYTWVGRQLLMFWINWVNVTERLVYRSIGFAYVYTDPWTGSSAMWPWW